MSLSIALVALFGALMVSLFVFGDVDSTSPLEGSDESDRDWDMTTETAPGTGARVHR